jgi:RNA polymerase sigma factor (sigma-70 family)
MAAPHNLLDHLRLLVAPPDYISDAALLDRFVRGGDQSAFTALVNRHGAMVMRVCRRVLADPTGAEDCFQATFLILARKAKSLRRPAALSAWLHGVALRVASNARKSRRKLVQLPASAQVVDIHPDPLDQVTARELLLAVDEEIQRIPEKYRLVVVLCCLENLSQEAAARQLGWTPGSVRARLERGRRRLETRLARRGFALSAGLAGALLTSGMAGVGPGLRAATVHAVLTSEGASATAAALANGAIHVMFLAKLKTIGLALLLCCGVGWGGSWLAWRASGGQVEKPGPVVKVAPSQQPQAKGLDLHGDPLPPGAAMRLGTVQLRAAGARLALSADGKTLVGVLQGKFIHLWDVESGKLKGMRELPVHAENNSYECALSHGGKLVVTGDMEVRDVQTGKLLRKLPPEAGGRIGEVKCFSPDGNSLATVASPKANTLLVRVWDLATGNESFAKNVESKFPITISVSFTPDGKKLLAYFLGEDLGMCCWDIANGQKLWNNKTLQISAAEPSYSADGTTLLSSMPPLDVATGHAAKVENLPNSKGDSGDQIVALPDGRRLLVSSAEGVGIWDLKSGKFEHTLPGAGDQMILAPNGKSVFTNKGALQRWNLITGKPLYRDNYNEGHWEKVS